jgi:hypothetical protein
MKIKCMWLLGLTILAMAACTSPAEQFIKAYPHKCMRINDQWIDKDGKQTSRVEEFPCKISGDDLPAIAK